MKPSSSTSRSNPIRGRNLHMPSWSAAAITTAGKGWMDSCHLSSSISRKFMDFAAVRISHCLVTPYLCKAFATTSTKVSMWMMVNLMSSWARVVGRKSLT